MKANGLALNDFDPKDGKGFESVTLRLKNQFEVRPCEYPAFPGRNHPLQRTF
jgi:hypothetical protein